MENANSLKRFTTIHSDPHMPIATQQTDISDGRTVYPEIDSPSRRLNEYKRREVSINLSTERSMNVQPASQDSSVKKILLFPMPVKPESKTLDLSIGDLSRKNTQSVHSDHQNIQDGADDYQQGEQVSMGTEESEAKAMKFKKFQSHTQLPARIDHYQPQSEAELRMEQRYINTLNRDLRLKQEEGELISKMHDYNAKKARIIRNSQTKVEAKKLFDRNKRTDQYGVNYDCRKVVANAEGGRMRSSVSLPQISSRRPSKIIDISTKQPVEVISVAEREQVTLSRRDQVHRLREDLQSVLQLTGVNISDNFLSNLLKGSLSSTKFYEKERKKYESKEDFEEGMQMMRIIEESFRKKGIDFDPKSLKKALMSNISATKELTRFPDSSLVSNPYYKRWGL